VFEVAELGHAVAKAEYKARVPELRTRLLTLQQRLLEADFPVLVLVSGVDGAGKGATVNLLNEWLDPRHLRTYAFGPKSDEERERPDFWRFWRALPPHGHIGIYVGSWYSDPIADRLHDRISDADLDARLQQARAFEKMLADDGALVIKFWLHLSRTAQKERLDALAADPETAWRVTRRDREHLKLYDRFRAVAGHALRETSTGDLPWVIVEGADPRYRHLTVGRHLADRLETHLDGAGARQTRAGSKHIATPTESDPRTVLDTVDLSRSLPKKAYKAALTEHQNRLSRLSRRAAERGVSSIVVLEGWDAAGKGGIIRRIVPALDARHFQVIQVAAPTDEERAHHYLWRFWRHIPRAGNTTVYDRSWYGRVLVERVEGLCSEAEWLRAYAELDDFERQLTGHGIVLVKLWLHIDPDEQLRRFQEREQVPWKRHKITEEDYRNREKRALYEHAVNDMVERTGTEYAPWTLIAANDKRHARIEALKTFCERLEAALDGAAQPRPSPGLE